MEIETKILIAVVILALVSIVITHQQNPCYDMCDNPMLSFVLYHKFCIEDSPSFNHNFYQDRVDELNECRRNNG